MGSADFFMRHRALPWSVTSIRLRIWFVTVVLGAITLQIPGLRAQTTSTTEGIVADQQGLPVAGAEIHVLNSGMGIDRSAKSERDRKSTRLNSSHSQISYAVFCLKKKNTNYLQIATTDS